MKELLQNFVEEAFGFPDMSPNDAIIKVVMKNKDTLNEEMIKRMVEMFNVKSFKKRQDAGADLEESFPVADSAIIIKKVYITPKEDVGFAEDDPVPFKGIDDVDHNLPIDIRDKQPEICIIEEKKKKASIDLTYPIQSAAEACSNYILKLKKASNSLLHKELRFMFPNSKILKLAGLEKGAKKIPVTITEEHKEFETIHNFFEKFAKDKEKKNKDPVNIVPENLLHGDIPVIPLGDSIYGYQVSKNNKGRLRHQLIQFEKPLSGYEKEPLPGGYYAIKDQNYQDLRKDNRVTNVSGLQDALEIANAGSVDKYIAKKYDSISSSPEDRKQKEQKLLKLRLDQDVFDKKYEQDYLTWVKDTKTPGDVKLEQAKLQRELADSELKDVEYSSKALGIRETEKLQDLAKKDLEQDVFAAKHTQKYKDWLIKEKTPGDVKLEQAKLRRELLDDVVKEEDYTSKAIDVRRTEKLQDLAKKDLEQGVFTAKHTPEYRDWLIKEKTPQEVEIEKLKHRQNLIDAKSNVIRSTAKDLQEGFSAVTAPVIEAGKIGLDEFGKLQKSLSELSGYWLPKDKEVTPGDIVGNLTGPTKEYLQNILLQPAMQVKYMDQKTDELLQFMRRKNIFESIVENDPDLHGADPKQLLRYYRDITQLAPIATLQPEITRSLLRASNAIGSSAIDPTTALNLVKLEERLHSTRNPRFIRKKDEDDV